MSDSVPGSGTLYSTTKFETLLIAFSSFQPKAPPWAIVRYCSLAAP